MGESGRIKSQSASVPKSASDRATFPSAPAFRQRAEMFRGDDGYQDPNKLENFRFDTRPAAIRMMKKYVEGSDKTRASVVEHLTDENYHEWAKALESGDVAEAKRQIDSIYLAKAGKAEKEFWKKFGL